MNQKGFANIVLIVLVVMFVGVLGYFVLTKQQEPPIQQSTTPPPTTVQTPTQQELTPTPSANETAPRPEAIMQYIKSGRGIEPPLSAPKIYIHSPRKDDVWEIGSKQVIKWSFDGDFQSLAYKSTAVIFTCGSANYYYEIIKSFDKGIAEAPTSLEWTVPNRALNRNDCKIRIEYNTSNSSDFGGMYSPEVGYWSSSEQFTVTTPGTGSPNITVISPRSVEVIKIGQPYTIQWRRERLSKGVRIYVYRGNEVLGYLDKGPFAPIFDFSYVWDAGSLIRFGGSAVLKESLAPGGDYRLHIVTQDWTTNGPPPEARAFSESFTLIQ